MSDSQTYEEITVASDGVTVTKRFEADEFPVPAIAFNVVSKRTEAVNIRLVDSVPDDVAVEDLGFHPEYGSEFWDINDDEITFEKELEPEADYTTVYGIRATGTDDVEKFLTEPRIENVDPPLDEDEADLVGGDGNAVKDVISGDSDSVPGLEDDEDEDIETLNLKDPNSDGTVEPDTDGETAAEGDDAAAPDDAAEAEAEADVDTGNVIAAMANEIRNNNVSAQDVKLLKRALDAVSEDTDPEGGVNSARLKRIQGDIADLRAYTDALEEFLAENGTGDEMIEEFGERLDAFDAQLNSFENELSEFEDEIDSAKSAAQAATEEIDELGGEVDSLETGLDDVEGSVDDVEGSVDAIEGELDSLEAEIEDVREELGEGEIDERLSQVEEEIVELQEWRDQLSSVIG